MRHVRWIPVLAIFAVGLLGESQAVGQLGVPITAPAPLNTNATTDSKGDWGSQTATDGAGHWVSVWYSGNDLGGTIGPDYDILVSRSTDHGASWTTTVALNSNAASDGGNDREPALTTDGLGSWVAVWSSDENLGGSIGADLDVLIARSADNGIAWTSPQALNTNADADSGQDENAHVITDGLGTWLAVWQSGDDLGGTVGTDLDILTARSTDGGATWSAPAAVNTNAASDTGNDWNPRATTDRLGNWVAIWDSNENLGGTVGTDRDILLARSTDNGTTWSAPQVLNTNADSDGGDDMYPQATTDGLGNWVAVWWSEDNLGGTIGPDKDVLVARSTDSGATWSAPGPLNSDAGSDTGHDYLPQVTTDGAGTWVTVWSCNDDLGGTIGTDYDSLVARSTDNGTTWSAPQALNTNASSDSGGDECVSLTTDGLGNWVAVWESSDDLGGTVGGDADILLARFALPDCNGNGASDTQDIAGGTSADCDGNSVPDECQPDADGDAIIDACEAPCGCGATSAVLMSVWALWAARLARRRGMRLEAARQ